MFANLLVGSIVLLVGLWWYVKKKYSYFRDRNILYVKPKFPLGNIGSLGKTEDMFSWLNELYFKFCTRDVLGGFFMGTAPIIIITDLEVIQDILTRDFNKFSEQGFYMNEKQDPMSVNLFSMHGENWRNLRTKLCPAFSQCRVQSMFPTVHLVANDLVTFMDQFVQNREPFDVKNVTMRYICDTIGSCAFGLDCKALTDDDPFFLKIADQFLMSSRFEILFWFFKNSHPKFAKLLGLKVFPVEVTKKLEEIITETMEFREANNIQLDDFLNTLLQIKKNGLVEDESGELIGNISQDALVAQAFAIFLIGLFTSRVTLTFALFELALHQDIQHKVRQEIIYQTGSDGELTFENMSKMEYLQQIVDETLRKYPPTLNLQRKCNVDYKVRNSDHIIEKGMTVYIPISGIHNDPNIYPDPVRFDPDRMTSSKMKERHPSSFMPFGSGPRICIGQRFGYLQVKVALAVLLMKFRFTINSKTKQPLTFAPLACDLDVTEGIWLDAHPL